jgi:hypothetical protein
MRLRTLLGTAAVVSFAAVAAAVTTGITVNAPETSAHESTVVGRTYMREVPAGVKRPVDRMPDDVATTLGRI